MSLDMHGLQLYLIEKQKKSALILDGHGFYINMKFINYCDANKILLAIYPFYSTYTLQPLNVSLFSPLAKAYNIKLK
jgi:hypothetical protein